MNAMAIVAVVVAAGTVAFKAPVNQEWVFTGTAQSQMKVADNYSLTAPDPVSCDNSKPLPCSITVDADDRAELQAFLDPRSTSQILSAANGRRN